MTYPDKNISISINKPVVEVYQFASFLKPGKLSKMGGIH
jgi:hypothetical protein